jgi:acyl-CoA synthetase (AMP-forming)/AMP-acid ligase II
MQITPQARLNDYRARGWWGERTIDDLLRAAVAQSGDQLALVDPLNREALLGDAPQRLTFAEVDARVDAMARALVSAGVGRDDIVLTQLPNIIEGVLAFLACARIGAILSPVAMAFRTHELTSVIEQLDPALVLTVRDFHGCNHANLIAELNARNIYTGPVICLGEGSPFPSLDESQRAAEGVELSDPGLHSGEVATVCWTSGTEAAPKGVPRHHAHWVFNGECMVEAAMLDEGDRILNPFPLINIAAFGGMVIPWLLCRGCLVQHHPFDLVVFLKQFEAERINYTVAPPAILTMLLKKPELLEGIDFSRVKCIASGSAPLPPFMVKAWQDQFGVAIMNVFGSNEGCSLISTPVVMEDPELRAALFPRFGVAGLKWEMEFPGRLKTRLVDPDTELEITKPGLPGELRIDGAMVFDSYWRNPGLSEEAFDAEGYFRTGDLFEIAEEEGGRFYRFVGRCKEIIIRGGVNISPAELDSLIESHPAVREAACAAYPDERLGERVCAVVATQPDEKIDLEQLVKYLKEKDISVYKLPEKLIVVPGLPRNPLGKVVRRDLTEIALR